MNTRVVLTIVRKELLETLRDKRTLIAMIGIPLVLYPALFLIVTQVITLQQAKMEEKPSRVALVEPAAPVLREWLSGLEKIELVSAADPRAAIQAGEIDAAIVPEDDLSRSLTHEGSATIRIAYDGTEPESRKALERIRQGLGAERDKLLKRRLEKAGLSEAFIKPLVLKSENIASVEKKTGSFLAGILPMLVIVMVGVGAFYPAVDVTAGEKERGTFETLLSTPTSKLEIVTGKFITVFCLSMFTGLLNLASMTLSLTFQLAQLTSAQGENLFSLSHVSFLDFALIFAALIPLAFFICGVMMSIAIFARDFKEAQNFVTPFYILILLPGIVTSMPGVELSTATQFVPIANVALLFKAILTAKAGGEAYIAVFICTSVYALLALVLAAWLFQSEQVILSEEKGFPLSLRRDDFEPRDTPTIGMSLMIFALFVLILYYPASYVQGREIISGLLITQWILFLAPILLLLWYTRINLRKALSWRAPPLLSLIGGPVLAIGGFVLVIQFGIWQSKVLPESEALKRMTQELFSVDGRARSLWLLLLAVAVSPAVCEEVVFRGAILSGVRSKLSFWGSVVLVGVLFGLFHVSVYRILPTAVLGMTLTYAVLRSGSIFTSMLMHFVNNTLGVLIATEHLPQRMLESLNRSETEGTNLPGWLLLSACGAVVIGVGLIELSRRMRNV